MDHNCPIQQQVMNQIAFVLKKGAPSAVILLYFWVVLKCIFVLVVSAIAAACACELPLA